VRFFAVEEAAAIRAAPPLRRLGRFYAHWALKEAYVKARGLGLSVPLDRICFRVEPSAVAVEFRGGLLDDPARWTFAVLQPTRRHVLALAAARPGVEVRVRHGALRVGPDARIVVAERNRRGQGSPGESSRRGCPAS
jgi:phosphopantetheinyl transferase